MFEEAMATDHWFRDEPPRPVYEFTAQFAGLAPPPPEEQQLTAAVRTNREASTRFVQMFAAVVSPGEFFAPWHIARILGSAMQHRAAARAPGPYDARSNPAAAVTGDPMQKIEWRAMARSPFVVGIVQDPAGPDTAANVARAERHIRDAARRGAQIVCLKELFHAPYFCKAEDTARFDLAEPIPGPTTSRMQALAKELAVVLVVPIFERQAAGVYRNSAAVIDADGELMGVYRKMHIPDDPLYYEKFYFTPGEVPQAPMPDTAAGFRVWKTRYATIGVLICWDQWFPEAARITSLLGAEVLFYPTAIGWHPFEKAEWGATQLDSWRTIQRAHAIANGVYVASPNRIGHEDEPGTDGLTFFGHSFIADPSGRIIADAGEEETVLVATCDPAQIESTRRNWPFLRDRRIDAYAPLLQRHLAE